MQAKNLSLSDEDIERLNRIRAKTGNSHSEIVRRALLSYAALILKPQPRRRK